MRAGRLRGKTSRSHPARLSQILLGCLLGQDIIGLAAVKLRDSSCAVQDQTDNGTFVNMLGIFQAVHPSGSGPRGTSAAAADTAGTAADHLSPGARSPDGSEFPLFHDKDEYEDQGAFSSLSEGGSFHLRCLAFWHWPNGLPSDPQKLPKDPSITTMTDAGAELYVVQTPSVSVMLADVAGRGALAGVPADDASTTRSMEAGLANLHSTRTAFAKSMDDAQVQIRKDRKLHKEAQRFDDEFGLSALPRVVSAPVRCCIRCFGGICAIFTCGSRGAAAARGAANRGGDKGDSEAWLFDHAGSAQARSLLRSRTAVGVDNPNRPEFWATEKWWAVQTRMEMDAWARDDVASVAGLYQRQLWCSRCCCCCGGPLSLGFTICLDVVVMKVLRYSSFRFFFLQIGNSNPHVASGHAGSALCVSCPAHSHILTRPVGSAASGSRGWFQSPMTRRNCITVDTACWVCV